MCECELYECVRTGTYVYACEHMCVHIFFMDCKLNISYEELE